MGELQRRQSERVSLLLGRGCGTLKICRAVMTELVKPFSIYFVYPRVPTPQRLTVRLDMTGVREESTRGRFQASRSTGL